MRYVVLLTIMVACARRYPAALELQQATPTPWCWRTLYVDPDTRRERVALFCVETERACQTGRVQLQQYSWVARMAGAEVRQVGWCSKEVP